MALSDMLLKTLQVAALLRPVAFGAAVLLAGCKDTVPTSVIIQLPSLVSTSAKGAPLSIKVTNQKGEDLAEAAAQAVVTAEPPNVAVVVSGNSELRCLKSGLAKVTARVGSLTQSADVRCVLIKRVVVAPLTRQFVGREAPFEFQAFDESNALIADPPCSVGSSRVEVATVEASTLSPKSVGRTRITVTCAEASDDVDVTVVETFETKSFTLQDGERTEVEVPQGVFEATLETKGDPLDISWVGGTGCGSDTASTHSVTTCKVASAAKLQVVNPAVKTSQGLIGGVLTAVFGSSTDSNAGVSDGIITLLRLPDERPAPPKSAKPAASRRTPSERDVEGEKSPRVEAIRSRYQELGASQKTLSRVEKSIFGMSAEGSSLVGYFDRGDLKKVEWNIYGEGGQQLREMTFHEGRLEFFFMRTKGGGVGGLAWPDSEQRYYLDGDAVIWATQGQGRVPMGPSDVATGRAEILEMRAQAVEALKAKAAELSFENGKFVPAK